MLRTRLCELVGIEVPVVQAGMSVYTSPELAAAVSEAGGLGSLGLWQRGGEQVQRDLDDLRERTSRPFALNHVVPALDEDVFAQSLLARPTVVSFALDDAGPLVDRVHDAGSLAMQQVHTVEQAERAVASGVDIVVAQGGEAGGFGGGVATLALVPQVVDAVSPVPVVAAGGIADGRGLAAALALGAVGVNLGSRFLASTEAPVGARWKETLRTAPAEDWVKLGFVNDIQSNPGAVGYGTVVRGHRSAFTEKWEARRQELQADPTPAIAEIGEAVQAGRLEELLVFGGQSAGLIDDVLPVGEIIRRVIADAEAALQAAAVFVV